VNALTSKKWTEDEWLESDDGPATSSATNRRVYDSIVDLIPGPDNPTPLVRVSDRFNPDPGYELLLKLEGINPFGSVKDRAAFSCCRVCS